MRRVDAPSWACAGCPSWRAIVIGDLLNLPGECVEEISFVAMCDSYEYEAYVIRTVSTTVWIVVQSSQFSVHVTTLEQQAMKQTLAPVTAGGLKPVGLSQTSPRPTCD